MTLDTYAIAPSPTSSNDGDCDQLMQNTGAASQSVTETAGFIGSQLVGFFQHPTVCFFRFEVTMPAGAVILGIEFNAKSAASGTLGPIDMTGGFCKRQGTANAWEDSTGVSAWTNQAHIPFGEANTFAGVQTYPAVWWGDAPAFTDESMDVVTGVGQPWTIGEGSLTGGTAGDVTGMVAQLQSYMDDSTMEATRGDTEAGAISVLFQIYRDHPGTSNQSQPLRFSNHTNSASHPTLKVDWVYQRAAKGTPKIQTAATGSVKIQTAATGSVKIE